MNKSKSKFIFISIVLVIIIAIVAGAFAFTVKDGTTVSELIDATQSDDFYNFDVSDAMGKKIGLNSDLKKKGGYCIDPHTQMLRGNKYEIVNVFDINNSTNTVKVYSLENKAGTEYSLTDPKVKPLLMLSYLSMKANERPADMTMNTGYKPVIWRIFQSKTWVNNLRAVGLSQSFQTSATGDGVLIAPQTQSKLAEAEKYAEEVMAGQSTTGDATFALSMTDEEKSNVSVIVDGGKTYIGPYKLTLNNGCKVGEITINGTEKADGISTDLKETKSVSSVVDEKEFYVVLNKELDKVTSIKVKGSESVKTIKSRMLLVGNSSSQNFLVWKTEEAPSIPEIDLEVPKFGSLQILKEDEFENSELNLKDIGFVVWSESKKAYIIKNDEGKIEYVNFETAKKNEFKTDKDGKTEAIKNLPLGKYKIYETSIPESLKDFYELPEATINDKDGKTVKTTAKLVMYDGKETVSISSGTAVTVTAKNNRDFIAKFYIIKRDKDTRELLDGIEFKMFKVSDDGLENHWVVFDEKNKVTSTNGTFDEATPLITVDGKTQLIKRLPIGKYMIFETGVGDNTEYEVGTYRMNGGLVPGSLIDVKELKADKTGVTYIDEENEQVFVDISGKVWEDVKEGSKRLEPRNETLGEEDNRINGIEVKLKNSTTGAVVQTTKTAYDKTSNENGVYRFEQVRIKDLGNLYIEFTYDGVTYQSVATTGVNDNQSKASETDSRQTVNNKFKELTGEGQKFESGETLTYTKTGTDSNIKVTSNNIGDRTLDEASKVVTMTKQGDFTVNSVTNGNDLITKYQQEKNKDASKKVKEITNINLGVYVREHPELRLVKNVENAQVSINGKKYTYSYAKKDGETPVTLGVSFEDIMRQRYNLPLYRTDVEADLDESKDLKVFITYKVTLVNESSILYSKVNAIKDIYSSDFEFDTIYTINENGSKEVLYDSAKESTDGDYKSITFNNLNVTLKPKESKDLYVTYKLPKEKFVQTEGNKKTLYADKEYRAYSEITSYSVYSDEFKSLFAGFDNNSIPNNFDVNKAKETYEDDTGVSGGLKLVDAGERKTTGIVFEDSDANPDDNQRIGNSKYEEEENKVANVKVNLIDTATGEVVTTATTNENGEYELSGFLPGDYKLEFVWGEGQNTTINGNIVKVDRYKSTIWTDENLAEKANKDWFKSTDPRFSDALDNYDMRIDIDSKTNDLLKALENDDNTATMSSKTQDVDFGIEKQEYVEILEGDKTHYEYNVENIDFGIIERPIQSINVEKIVNNIEIKTANGETITNARINENGKLEGEMKGVTGGSDYGFIKVEMDTSLLSGATARVGYKIKIKNTSEIDYDSKEYYLYGKEDENKKITQTAEAVYDYLGGITPESDVNTQWKVIPGGEVLATLKSTVTDKVMDSYIKKAESTTTEGGVTTWVLEEMGAKTEKLIEEWAEEMVVKGDTYKSVKLTDKIVSVNELSNIKLGAGEEKEFSFYSNRLLSAADEIVFENDAEITNVIRDSKTGSIVSLKNSDFYTRAEKVTVTPPTGEDKNYTPIIIIAISSIVVLGLGIVIIKKTVLKK